MDIASFDLERWFDEYEHDADIMLAESGIRSLDSERFDTDPGELGYVIPTDGDPDLRAEVAGRHDRTADELAFTCGAQEANFLAYHALMDEGGHAVVVTPTYQALTAVPDAIGDVTEVSLNPATWELDVDAVREAIRPETDVVAFVNPNNPTGRHHDAETVEELYEVAASHDAYLLGDEVYRLLAENPTPPVASLGEYGVSTSSLSKSYGLAGLRFGWLCGPREVVDAAVEWKDYTTISPGVFGQHVARQALGEQEAEILAENHEIATRNHDIVADWLDEHGLDWHDPTGVNGFVTVPDAFAGSREFCRTVVEDAGVVLAPGDCFGYDDYFRIGFGLPTEKLEAGLERVSAVLRA
ncbi:aminotransferase class I/II-fold pyridoxal phosphate-dependent enzyme [Salarchaeum japonicum]|uniref:aminotransferase class I/II-fold pyridoxal phosphate-dependent enzyme n=1 Tax=Salarchaeum japonicum TaxID=555573 RepID=UPI003C74B61D